MTEIVEWEDGPLKGLRTQSFIRPVDNTEVIYCWSEKTPLGTLHKSVYSKYIVFWWSMSKSINDHFQDPINPTEDEMTLVELEYGVDCRPLLGVEDKLYQMGLIKDA